MTLRERTTTCPICKTQYSVSLRPAGRKCRDWSQDQKRPCVGLVMPTYFFDLAEWRTR